MVRLIETIILNVLSNEIFLKNKSCFGKLRMRKHKNVLLKQIREYMNSHDGTIITSGEFDRFLQYSKPVEKILGHVTNAQDALSKEGFIDEQINSFANQYSDGKKLSPIDRMELFSFFDFCYSSFDHFCRSLLLSDEQKLTISLLMSKIASLKENSDKKVESIINSTRRVEKGVDELRGEMDELKQLITGNHQITDEATIRRAYSVIVNSLFNGDIDSVVNLLPIIKDKNNDLGLCAEYLIGLLSDYPSSVSFSDIQCKVVDDLLYEDITRRSLYISLLEKDTTLFDKINDRSSELFTIAKKLQRNEHDSFYTICKNETQTGTCYNYSVNSQDYPSHHWLIKRICVIEVLNSNTINASEVVTKALKDDYTFIDSIIISERKAAELISRLSRSLDDLKQLYEELAGTKDRVQHLLYSIQKKYYITLLKLSIILPCLLSITFINIVSRRQRADLQLNQTWRMKGDVQKLISVLSILFFILGICRKIGFAAHCLGGMGIVPLSPGIPLFGELRCFSRFELFVVVLVEVVADRDQEKLHPDQIQASADDPAVLPVLLHDPEGAFRLDRPVHPQERAMGTVQIVQHLPVYRRQFLIQADRPVPVALLALVSVRSAAAVLTLVDFLLTPVPVPFHILPVCEQHLSAVGAEQVTGLIRPEVHRTERVEPVLPVLALFLVQGEFHVFLHAVLGAVQVVVI